MTCEFQRSDLLIPELDKEKREGWDGKARQRLSGATYALVVQANNGTQHRGVLNRKDVARAVNMSIKGLVKKIKYFVKADEVIYLYGSDIKTSGMSDVQASALRDLVPRFYQVENWVKAAATNAKAMNTLEDKFSRISRVDGYKRDDACREMRDVWDRFVRKYPSSSDLDKIDVKPVNAFRDFLEEYRKFSQKYFEEDLSETMYTAYDVLDSLFGRIDEQMLYTVFEDEDPEEGMTQ